MCCLASGLLPSLDCFFLSKKSGSQTRKCKENMVKLLAFTLMLVAPLTAVGKKHLSISGYVTTDAGIGFSSYLHFLVCSSILCSPQARAGEHRVLLLLREGVVWRGEGGSFWKGSFGSLEETVTTI